ncbi:hypothetical protein GGQ84_003081 [Desulfitispora alkaliphila]|uniref:hypothetical protein n=1 Tax=Desulfitispora alkaliphila TaxID=622674 RepID=UPI003D221157
MFLTNILFALLFLLLLYWAVKQKVIIKVKNLALDKTPDSPKSSPASEAITELVATAGGIYLSLVTLTSFLEIEVPEKITVLTVQVEPLAFISIGITLVQPFITNLINYRR